jgi:pimeloyl-ACP methyl ester carboxylesterase
MRFVWLTGCCWVLVASAGWAMAQSGAAVPAHFSLEIAGQPVGSADYSLAPADQGFHLQASYSFTTRGVAVKCSREADLDAQYGLLEDSLAVNASGTDEDVTVTVDPGSNKLTYKLKSSVQDIEETKDLHPGTVVLNNFDPSGVQHLVWLAAAHPMPDGNYWALLAQGKGVYLPVKLTPADAGAGTLDGTKLVLKHWQLEISGTDTEIWADSQNRLMEFDVQAQQVSYKRSAFERTPTETAKPPLTAAVEERNVSFTSDGLKFPAILTLPKNRTAPVPAMVLVQGSGPQDADETIGPNKPFRDLASGLAAEGIASLRYDKRTHLAPQTFQSHPDLDHEVTLDAVAALQYITTQPEIDRSKIFLLGHSLGGTMAPVIASDFLATRHGSLRGIIFMAAGAASIDETIVRQTAFQAARHDAPSAPEPMQKQWQDVFATVKDTNTPADRVLGVGMRQAPAGYWRSWLQQDPAAELAKLGLPALVLRGFKDIQISEKDFKRLEEANTAPGSVGEQFDGLNHLFMPVAGESTGDTYLQPGHVSPDVITTIAVWIKTLR